MKNTNKLFWVISLMALIMVATVFLSCGSSISGTFSSEGGGSSITFKGKSFILNYGGTHSGNYVKIDDKISLPGLTISFTIIDRKTLQVHGPSNAIWRKN